MAVDSTIPAPWLRLGDGLAAVMTTRRSRAVIVVSRTIAVAGVVPFSSGIIIPFYRAPQLADRAEMPHWPAFSAL